MNAHHFKTIIANQQKQITHLQQELESFQQQFTFCFAKSTPDIADIAKQIEKHPFDPLFEGFFNQLPGNFFWFNRDQVMLACNENQVHSLGYACKVDLIGKTSTDIANNIGWDREVIDKLYHHNSCVINQCKSIVVEEEAFGNKQTSTWLSYKNPLVDKKGQVIGLVGASFNITERKLYERNLLASKNINEVAYLLMSESGINQLMQRVKSKKILVQIKDKSIALSIREVEVLLRLFSNSTAKEIAKCMALSPRTIEGYLAELKQKLSCTHRSSMLKLLANQHFLANFV